MRPLFKGAFYSFLSYKGAPIIQGRPLIKGAHYLTVDPFLRVQLQHTDFELEVSGDELVQGDHKTMG